MVLTVNVSPPGSHSLRMISQSGEEETVSYNITDTDSDGQELTTFFTPAI